MLRISINKYGTSPKELSIKLEKNWWGLQAELMEVGKRNHAFIVGFIQSHKKRPGSVGKLEKAIDFNFYTHGYTAGFSIGNVEKLNQEAPHWRANNFGSSHIVGMKVPVGGFTPGTLKPDASAFRQGRWNVGEANYCFTAKKPIPPMNFVENSHHELRVELASMIRKAKAGLL